MPSKEPLAKLVTITPQYALELLVNNTMNRPISARLVVTLTEQIKGGLWMVNGDAIRISDTGKILDGQHRLMAIEAANMAVETFIVTGLPEACFKTININCRSRTPSDVLAISGEQYSAPLSATLNWLARHELGSVAVKDAYPVNVLQDMLAQHPQVRESVRLVKQIKCKLLPAAPTAFMHYLFHVKDAELADIFVQGMQGGYDGSKFPNFALYHGKLIRDYTSRVKAGKEELVILGLKAWNAQRTGKRLQVLRWEQAEGVPKIL